MGRSTKITYRLPCAVIVISGTVRRTLDKDRDVGKTLDGMRAELVSKTVQVRHQADDGSDRTVTVKGGWFFQYKSSFSCQEDGRAREGVFRNNWCRHRTHLGRGDSGWGRTGDGKSHV